MSANAEIELKLQCDLRDIERTCGHDLLRAAGLPKKVRYESVYFDTPGQKLREAGIILRTRGGSDGSFIQTVKTAGDGLLARSEWEVAITSPLPDAAALAETPAGELVHLADLLPAFTVVVDRTLFVVDHGESRIEIAFDRGEIFAGGLRSLEGAPGRRMAICEIELELKQGQPADLFAFADAIGLAGTARLGVQTKSERGYFWLDGGRPAIAKAEGIVINGDAPAADAFRRIANACIRQFRLNEDAFIDGVEPGEAVHQMRVAIRRLRSALSLFADIVESPDGNALHARLKALSAPLGTARELDVGLAETMPEAVARWSDESGIAELQQRLEAQRGEAHAILRTLLQAEDWLRLWLDLMAWINTGDWLTLEPARPEIAAADDPDTGSVAEEPVIPLRDIPAREFGAAVLDRQYRRVRKRGRRLDHDTDEDRHRLRIAAKKLRYGADFFAGAFASKKETRRRDDLDDALRDLQQHLGAFNDAATTRDLMKRALTGGASQEVAFAAGLVTAGTESAAYRHLGRARRAVSALMKVEPFWR